MQKKTAVAIYLILVFGIASCSGGFSTSVATQTPKAIGQASPTLPAKSTNSPTEPAPAIAPTQMSTAAASTLSPTTTATVESEYGIIKNCVNILPALPQPNNYQGKLILDTISYAEYFYDFRTAKTMKLPNLDWLDIAVTPDGKKYAYHDYGTPYLKIYSSDGRLQRSIPWENDWFLMNGWLNSNRLMFEIPKVTPITQGHSNIEYPEPLMLLNLTTNQRQKLLPDYPGIDTANTLHWWSGTTVYDASLSRVVYPGSIIEGEERGYILWDVPNKKKIIGLNAYDYTREPIWSPDGSKFFVNNGIDFFIVTRDGAISKITHSKGNVFDSPAYSWSPDGRYVALWLDNAAGNFYTLVVLDTQTEKMTDYCIQSEYGRASDNNSPFDPVWSPDGKSFVVSANTNAGQPEGDTVLVDIEKSIAAKVATGLVPIGWLAAP
jgi:hypothetical protein